MEAGRRSIKEIVKQHYTAVASGVHSCDCSGERSEVANLIYPTTDLMRLPNEAVAASAGCGNPTAMASLKEGEVVLDLGSGGGIDCFLAAQAIGPSGKVIGVDMTPDMVSLAKRNAERLGLSNVEFYHSEIENLPLEDESVDVIISNCVINLSTDKDAVFRESFRVLRRGGRLHVSDMVLLKDLPEEIASDPENWASCIAGAESKSDYLDRMRNAGFTEINTIDEPNPSANELQVGSITITAYKGPYSGNSSNK